MDDHFWYFTAHVGCDVSSASVLAMWSNKLVDKVLDGHVVHVLTKIDSNSVGMHSLHSTDQKMWSHGHLRNYLLAGGLQACMPLVRIPLLL